MFRLRAVTHMGVARGIHNPLKMGWRRADQPLEQALKVALADKGRAQYQTTSATSAGASPAR